MSRILNKIKTNKKVKVVKNESFKGFMERNRLSHGYLLKKEIGLTIFKFCRAVMLFGLCFLILQPILNKVSVSFMLEKDLYDSTVINIPRNWSVDNYKMVSMLSKYWKSLFTTLWITLVIALVQVISTTLVGYGFARYKFPGKGLLFGMVILSIVVPPQTIMTALYINFRYFDFFGILKLFGGKPINLLGSLAPYVIMSATGMGLRNGLYIYMLRQYFRGIPKELEEAAYVDGCGKLKTFVVIMLPDARPMLTSIFLFAYVWQWTDTFYTTLFLKKFNLLSSQLSSLAERLGKHLSLYEGIAVTQGYSQAIVSTGTLMVIIPLILIYLVAQKGFVESLAQAGIKM